MQTALRQFSELHIDEDCRDLTGQHENGLFFNCKFEKLNGLTLKDCDLNRSQFVTETLRDALGLTLTLDCFSFKGVELSPLLFDLLLLMLHISAGNDEKRERLLDVIGQHRAAQLLRIIEGLE